MRDEKNAAFQKIGAAVQEVTASKGFNHYLKDSKSLKEKFNQFKLSQIGN